MSQLLRIATIGGDGTGPEVVAEGVKVLKEVCKLENINLELVDFDISGNRYLKNGGIIITDEEVAELGKFSSILLGAVGHPDVKPGILEKGLLLRLRFEFDQYINLRPVKLFQACRRRCAIRDPRISILSSYEKILKICILALAVS